LWRGLGEVIVIEENKCESRGWNLDIASIVQVTLDGTDVDAALEATIRSEMVSEGLFGREPVGKGLRKMGKMQVPDRPM
jgi:hypothetical protein